MKRRITKSYLVLCLVYFNYYANGLWTVQVSAGASEGQCHQTPPGFGGYKQL